DAEGDLEVERFLALLVDEGVHVLLQLPDAQWAQHVADHRHPAPEERRVMAEHRPPPRLRRGLRNEHPVIIIHGVLPRFSLPVPPAARRTAPACRPVPGRAWR